MPKADKMIGTLLGTLVARCYDIPHYCTPSIVISITSDTARYVVNMNLVCQSHALQ